MVFVLGASTPNLARHPKASVIRVPSSPCLEKLTRGERPGGASISSGLCPAMAPPVWRSGAPRALRVHRGQQPAAYGRRTVRSVLVDDCTITSRRPLCRRRYHLRTAYHPISPF